jgi:glycosyltransferase involved in cell wall biosynthesis/uncharacterized coiled-coil protein SlyX
MDTLTNNPLVSIIVRTKDRPKLLNNALSSIAAQTFRPIEVVLVNDGGCDLDVEEIKDILGDVSLNYIRLEKNTGRAHAGNVGIENAKGEYIGFLDDDDEFYSDHISILVSTLEKYGYKVAYSDAHIEHIDLDPERKQTEIKEKRIFSSRDFFYSELIVDNYIPLICLLISRDVFSYIQGFDESFDIYEDWDLLIRMAEKYHFYHVSLVTAKYIQWSSTLQIAQTPEFVDKAQAAHVHIINKHRMKFTPDIIRNLVRDRRLLREKENFIAGLEDMMAHPEKIYQEEVNRMAGLGVMIASLKLGLQEKERAIANLEDMIINLERKLQEKEGEIANLKNMVTRLERSLQEKEANLDRIYNSHGWKVLISYYKVRDRLLPPHTKRRVLVKAAAKVLLNPTKVLRSLNIMNMRKFFYYLKNADPSLFEYKIENKFSPKPSSDFSAHVSIDNDIELLSTLVEENSILFIGSFQSGSENDYIPKRKDNFVKYLRELNYTITLIDHDTDIEEYLKKHGNKFSFVLGIGTKYCFDYFPFVRAYARKSMLIYHAADLGDDAFSIELLNATIADGVIVDSEDKKKRLLQADATLQVGIVPNDSTMKSALGQLLTTLYKEKQTEKAANEKETVTSKIQKGFTYEGEIRERKNIVKKGAVLVAGVYLANQENAIEHIVDQFNQAKNYQVVQKWIALCGDAPSDNIKTVTTMKLESPQPKFILINKLLLPEQLDKYDYIVICDDDITLPQDFLDTFLYLQEKYNFAAAQPSRTHNSYIDHYFVEKMDGLEARHTRFVEIGPLLSLRHDLLPHILPLDERTPMGWGFDFVLPVIAEKYGLRIGIIDATPIDHSMRKPMYNYKYDDAKKAMEDYLSRNPHLSMEEAFTILESYT